MTDATSPLQQGQTIHQNADADELPPVATQLPRGASTAANEPSRAIMDAASRSSVENRDSEAVQACRNCGKTRDEHAVLGRCIFMFTPSGPRSEETGAAREPGVELLGCALDIAAHSESLLVSERRALVWLREHIAALYASQQELATQEGAFQNMIASQASALRASTEKAERLERALRRIQTTIDLDFKDASPDEIADHVQAMRDEHSSICVRLRATASNHELGLGGERLDALVCNALDATTEKLEAAESRATALADDKAMLWGQLQEARARATLLGQSLEIAKNAAHAWQARATLMERERDGLRQAVQRYAQSDPDREMTDAETDLIIAAIPRETLADLFAPERLARIREAVLSLAARSSPPAPTPEPSGPPAGAETKHDAICGCTSHSICYSCWSRDPEKAERLRLLGFSSGNGEMK